jgi:hypothetical protein
MTTERSGMSLEDRIEFALRDAGFDYDEASQIAYTATHLSSDAVVSGVSFSTVSAVVKTLSRVGHAAPESQEEQAARFESLVIDLCREVEVSYDVSATVISAADAIGLIDGLNMMANSSDSTGHDSEAEFLRCCAHAIHQSFAARHAAVPDAMVSKPYAATVWGVHSANGDIVTGWNACREAMLALRDGGKE